MISCSGTATPRLSGDGRQARRTDRPSPCPPSAARAARRCASTSRSPGHAAGRSRAASCAAALPAHYVAVLRLRGDGARRSSCSSSWSIPSGANVWWWRRPDFAARRSRRRLVLRKASLDFAWGPASGGEPERIGAVEIGAGGGRRARPGTLWIEELRIEPRDPRPTQPRIGRCHALELRARPRGRARARRRRRRTLGARPPRIAQPWLQLDLGRTCRIRRRRGRRRGPAASLPAVCWPRTTARTGRLLRRATAAAAGGAGCAPPTARGASRGSSSRPARRPRVAHVGIVPLELAVSPARYIGALARGERRAASSRAICSTSRRTGRWSAPTATSARACSSEDGALEVDAESFTLEPFLWTDGRLVTWADVDDRPVARRRRICRSRRSSGRQPDLRAAHHRLRRRHRRAQHAGRALRGRERAPRAAAACGSSSPSARFR